MRVLLASLLAVLAAAAAARAQAPGYPAIEPAGHLRPASIGCADAIPPQAHAGYGPHGLAPHGGHHGPCGPGCPSPCLPPCPPCYPPGPPRDAVPRDAVPRDAVPTGNYVAPPPTGAIVGPERGFDLGGLALVFPECKISLPRLRVTRPAHFFREGHMELDAARAAYVENPYALLHQQAVIDREAEPVPREAVPEKAPKAQPREALPPPPPPGKYPPSCPQPAPPGYGYDRSMYERLDRLEGALQLQMQAVQQCMEHLKQMQQPLPRQYEHAPLPVPQQAPAKEPPAGYGRLRLSPPLGPPTPEIGTASYVRPVAGYAPPPQPIREPGR